MNNSRISPRQQRSQEMVLAILMATEQLLVREGATTTTNRIAQRAGVSVGSLYRYFPDKDALFQEVGRRYAARLTVAVNEAERATHGMSLREGAPIFVHHMTDVENHEPKVGQVIARMRLDGWACAAMDLFEKGLEDRATVYLNGSDRVSGIRKVAARFVGPLMSRSFSQTISLTLARDPEVAQSKHFRQELTRMVFGFLRSNDSDDT